jgi:hypothetical protein
MKKLLPLTALLGAGLVVAYKARSRSGDDLWQQATSSN